MNINSLSLKNVSIIIYERGKRGKIKDSVLITQALNKITVKKDTQRKRGEENER
jgi:hypothetical protein